MSWKLYYTKQAIKDSKKIKQSGLKNKAQKLLDLISKDPFINPPSYEKLVGDLQGCYSRRINIQHRLVYMVYKQEKAIKILRMWTHYDSINS